MQRMLGRPEQLAQLAERRGVGVISVNIFQHAGQFGKSVRV